MSTRCVGGKTCSRLPARMVQSLNGPCPWNGDLRSRTTCLLHSISFLEVVMKHFIGHQMLACFLEKGSCSECMGLKRYGYDSYLNHFRELPYLVGGDLGRVRYIFGF